MASSTPKSSGSSGGGSVGNTGSNMDTLKDLFMIGHFIANFDNLNDPGNSHQHDNGCVAVKEQMNQVVDKISDLVSVLRGQLERAHGEKQELEKRLKELEAAGVKKDEEIHRLQGKLECEQWEKLEAKESMDALMKALQQFYQTVETRLEGHLTDLFPSGKSTLKEDVSNVKSKLNMISSGIFGKLKDWKDSQITILEELKKLKESLAARLDDFKLDLSTVLPSSPNKSLDVTPNEASVGPSVPKKKVRFSSELVQEKIIGEDEPHYDSEEGNESEQDLEEVDDLDFLELHNLGQPSNFRPFMLENGECHGWSSSPPSGVTEDSNKKMFWCVCGKGYVVKHVLFRHLLSKQKGKIFKCPLCPKVFALHKSVKRHVRNSHHVEYQEGAFGCRVCGQTYGTAKELYGHRVMEHPGVFRVPVPPKSTPENSEGEEGTKSKRIRTEASPKSNEKTPHKAPSSQTFPPDFDPSPLTPGAYELLMHLTRD